MTADAIDALTGLNEATAASEQAEGIVRDAVTNRSAAKKRLDEMQEAFDKFVAQLRANAPRDSYWGRLHRR